MSNFKLLWFRLKTNIQMFESIEKLTQNILVTLELLFFWPFAFFDNFFYSAFSSFCDLVKKNQKIHRFGSIEKFSQMLYFVLSTIFSTFGRFDLFVHQRVFVIYLQQKSKKLFMFESIENPRKNLVPFKLFVFSTTCHFDHFLYRSFCPLSSFCDW